MKQRTIWILSAGHFFTDVNQGIIAALLPFFLTEHHLSYAAAAGILFAANITSSIIQPIFGYYSDFTGINWLMPLGVLLAGLGVSLAGIAPNYNLILAAVAITGIGTALFHPDAARIAGNLTDDKKATNMSYFSVGGNLGFSVGPLLATALLSIWGLWGTVGIIIPSALMAVWLWWLVKQKTATTSRAANNHQKSIYKPDQWSSFILISAAVTIRSVIFFGMTTFLPIYWITVLHQSKAIGASALSLFFLTGAIGTIIGGRVAEKIGYRSVIISGLGVLIPCLLVYNLIPNLIVAIVLQILIGIFLYAPFSSMVVLGQKYLPNRMGLASGVTLGLAVSIGGLAAPAFGWLVDMYGIHFAMMVLVIFPVLATVLGGLLPEPEIVEC